MTAPASRPEPLPPARPGRLDRGLATLAVWGLLGLAGLVTIVVLSRWWGHTLIPDNLDLVQDLMVVVVMLPLGLVTAARRHVAVEVATTHLPRRSRAALSAFGHAVGLVFAGLLLWAGVRGLRDAWATQEYRQGVLDLPLWIPHALFVLGLLAFALRLAAMVRRDLRLRRRPR